MADIFEVRNDRLEVTSWRRPDTAWRFIDPTGHEHAWYVDGQPATHYRPSNRHDLPTLRWIVDVPATDDYPESGHHECRQCGERVVPRQKADDTRQYIAGLREYLINGEHVSPEEFERRWRQAQKSAGTYRE